MVRDQMRVRAVVGRGYRVLDAPRRLARTYAEFDRRRWLRQGRGVVPWQAASPHFRQPQVVSASDVELCKRLIDAYGRATDAAPSGDGMWSHPVFQQRQAALVDALDRRDPELLAGLLASMFRSDFVLGMHPGSLGVGPQPRFGRRVAGMSGLSKLVSLAEYLGCAPVENPEQGTVGLAFVNGGVAPLVTRLETTLGVSLDFPNVGAAYGMLVQGRLVAPDTADQVYAARRLLSAMEMHLPNDERSPRVVEIGGGYGAMAYWLLQMRDLPYVIVDLPIVNVLQGYFLAQALGQTRVSLYGEDPADVTITPDHAIGEIPTPVAALANKDSMPEIPRPALLGYLTWARSACQGIFYSYNQEAAAPFDGTPQNIVPDAVAEVGGFVRVRRDPSWVRRGYVEEIYLSTQREPR
jgi:hypothetical protein